jgi:hypothetical protein
MKSSTALVPIVACIAGMGLLHAETPAPFLAEANQNYTIVKNNLMKMAEKMPDEHYGFKPTDAIRSFGESVAHVADAQARSCSLVNGASKTVDAAAKKTKAELVAALKSSFEICDASFAALTDVAASQMVRLGQSTRERSKFGLLFGMISHSNEVYGYMSVYMRLKGFVPPSSEGQ